MNSIPLDGCRPTPLAGYLTALGALRAISRLLDTDATGHWERGRFVLRTTAAADVDGLASVLAERFEPLGVVSPWNNGSGFGEIKSAATASKRLDGIRSSDDVRLRPLKEAIAAADRIVRLGHARGWGGAEGRKLWDDKRKADVLALCRAELPDHALEWLDAAVAVGEDNPEVGRILGTGGNFGRLDISTTYVEHAGYVLGDRRSAERLAASLSGDETVPYRGGTAGQFDPGRTAEGFVNPWSFLLTIEGSLLFATAVVRRHGAEYQGASIPFQVRSSTGGYGTSAAGETPVGELWTPEWRQPAGIDELAHLFGEGRAEWRGSAARTGLDFVRAVSTLGVDRGLSAFERHVLVDRHGLSPIAVPAGRVQVERQPGVRLLAGLDPWLNRVRGGQLSAGVAARLRSVDEALFDLARGGGLAALVDVFAAVGRLHEAVGRSGGIHDRVTPLVLRNGKDLWTALRGAAIDDADLRVALAIATARDAAAPHMPTRAESLPTLRAQLTAVSPHPHKEWDDQLKRPSLSHGVVPALVEAARRRAFPRATPEIDDVPPTDVVGVRIAFAEGARLSGADIHTLVHQRFDDDRVGALVAGLLCVDWPSIDWVFRSPVPAVSDPVIDLLLPFTGPEPLVVRRTEEERPPPILLRPDSSWPARLAAGRVHEVLHDATRRLRIAGIRRVATPGLVDPARGPGLAALLVVPIAASVRVPALGRIAALPPTTSTQEDSA